MYGIFSYIWLIFMVNVGKYTIHGSYGYQQCTIHPTRASDRLEASLPELPGLVMWRGHEPTMTEPRPFWEGNNVPMVKSLYDEITVDQQKI